MTIDTTCRTCGTTITGEPTYRLGISSFCSLPCYEFKAHSRAALRDLLSAAFAGTDAHIYERSYTGSCPVCFRCDGYRNIGREHWCFCGEYRTKWLLGDNLFSSWQHEGPDVWDENRRFLAAFRVVEPAEFERRQKREPGSGPASERRGQQWRNPIPRIKVAR